MLGRAGQRREPGRTARAGGRAMPPRVRRAADGLPRLRRQPRLPDRARPRRATRRPPPGVHGPRLRAPTARTVHFGESPRHRRGRRRWRAGTRRRASCCARRSPSWPTWVPPLPVAPGARGCSRDRFPVVERIARSEVPLTVVYGDRDSVVPPGSAPEWPTRRRRWSSAWWSPAPTTTTRSCSVRGRPTRSTGWPPGGLTGPPGCTAAPTQQVRGHAGLSPPDERGETTCTP